MSRPDALAPGRQAAAFLLGVVVAATITNLWAATTLTRAACAVVLWPAWAGALWFACVLTNEVAKRFRDEPYFATAAWFLWSALTVALLGPAFHLSAGSLTALVTAGWLLAGLGLWLDLRQEHPPSPGLLSDQQIVAIVARGYEQRAETSLAAACRRDPVLAAIVADIRQPVPTRPMLGAGYDDLNEWGRCGRTPRLPPPFCGE